jgi:dTDP-4-amino-4,6-dideoxygalactose transaminase
MDTLQAAVVLERMKSVENLIQKRREVAGWYNDMLKGIVEIPHEDEGARDVYYTYTIRTPERDQLKDFLEKNGVETKIQHPILMPDQPAYRDKTAGSLPNAQRLVKEILCLPANEKLQREDIDYVAGSIREFFGRS